jgi:hypothetical protein
MFFKKIFPFFVFCFLLICFFACVVIAQTAAAPAPVPSIDLKSLPLWLQYVLGGFGVGGLSFWVVMKAKMSKFIILFEDCKLFITSTLNMVSQVKTIIETTTPDIKKVWYEWLYAAGNLLIETGNKSLIQKGQLLLSHVPAGAIINKSV